MLIYICCSGGATSGMLCQKIGEASKKKMMIGYIYDMLRNMNAYIKDYEVVIACGPVDFLSEANFKHTNLEDKLNCILISPQVRFMAPSIKKYFEKYHIAVDVINMKTFGTMDGEKVWKDIQKMLE